MRQKEKRFLLWSVELHSFLIQQRLRIVGKVGRGPGKGARRTTCVCVDVQLRTRLHMWHRILPKDMKLEGSSI